MQQCLFCGHIVTLIHVHGHYQCPVCTTNALPCCDGDNCETNFLLKEQLTGRQKLHNVSAVQESRLRRDFQCDANTPGGSTKAC